MVEGHKGEGRVDVGVDHLDLQPVALGDGRPQIDAGAAQRVDADLEVGGGDGLQVDDAAQIFDVRGDKVIDVGASDRQGTGVGQAADGLQAVLHDLVGAVLDGFGDGGVGGAGRGRVVFEAAVIGGVVRGGDDHAVGQPGGFAAVEAQDGVGDDRGGGVALPGLDDQLDAVGGEDLHGGGKRGLRKGVGIHAEVERPGGAMRLAVFTDGLADGEDMVLVEGSGGGRAAVSGGAEGHLVFADGGIGLLGVISADQARDVHQQFVGGRFASQGMRHSWILLMCECVYFTNNVGVDVGIVYQFGCIFCRGRGALSLYGQYVVILGEMQGIQP